MRYKRVLTSLILSFTVSIILAQDINIIPKPQSVKIGEGYFTLNEKISIQYTNPELKSLADYVSNSINSLVNLQLQVKQQKGKKPSTRSVNIFLDSSIKSNEGYELSVLSKQISIKANTPQGLFYGVQSLLQLIPIDRDLNLPCVEIKDEPRFPWRGFMFDVVRTFHSIDELKMLIDQMAMYKFNVFHLHLSDDQGWRVEIKSHPELTRIGGWRVPRTGDWHERQDPEPNEETTYGGFYTQEEIKDLVKYAAERNIQIMPEIDVPGHSLSAIVTYPNLSCTRIQYQIPINHSFYGRDCNALCAGRDSTFAFLDQVFDEIVALFPFKYIHIGGDECYRGFWAKCPDCQKRMQDNNLKDVKELQSYFIKRVEKILEAKGKKIVGWGEILDGGLAPDATVMSWIDMQAGIEAAKLGNDVIMTPRFPCYMDYYQGDPAAEPLGYRENRLHTCYHFEPVPDSVPAGLIKGGQACLWGEYTPNFRHAQYLFWPRSMALSEVFWSQKQDRNWDDFIKRLEPQLEKFDKLDYKYATSYLDVVVKPTIGQNENLQLRLGTEIEGLDIYYTFDNTFPDHHSKKYIKGDILDIPKTARSIIVVTYKGDKQVGKIITLALKDLKKRTQPNKDRGAITFEFD